MWWTWIFELNFETIVSSSDFTNGRRSWPIQHLPLIPAAPRPARKSLRSQPAEATLHYTADIVLTPGVELGGSVIAGDGEAKQVEFGIVVPSALGNQEGVRVHFPFPHQPDGFGPAHTALFEISLIADHFRI